jgi:hypothetical protein
VRQLTVRCVLHHSRWRSSVSRMRVACCVRRAFTSLLLRRQHVIVHSAFAWQLLRDINTQAAAKLLHNAERCHTTACGPSVCKQHLIKWSKQSTIQSAADPAQC